MLAFCKNKDSAFNRALQHASFQFQILVAEKSGSSRYPRYRSVLSQYALFFNQLLHNQSNGNKGYPGLNNDTT